MTPPKLLVDCSSGEEIYVDLTTDELEQRAVDEIEVIERKWKELRTHRNALLTACDWTQLPSAILTPSVKARWDTYRQELRDLPEATADPSNPAWPESPA